MDKSHICLFDVKITKEWFTNYEIKETIKICFDTNIFHSIISTKNENQDLIIKMDDADQDTLYINFISQEKESKKNEFKKFFKMPLVEYQYEEMSIPVVDYDAEFSLSSKLAADMFSQLSNFGNDINFTCSEDSIHLTSTSVAGEMCVQIPIDDLTSYSIVEGDKIILDYSLLYLNKMCITNKLSQDIEFCLSNECPMKIAYPLGEGSTIVFYMAPKST
jgi:proliferating cell nuclear antigen PCNA